MYTVNTMPCSHSNRSAVDLKKSREVFGVTIWDITISIEEMFILYIILSLIIPFFHFCKSLYYKNDF